MFGLPDHTITLIKNYFQQQPNVREVRVYGSRAMGKHKRGSDIDLAIYTTADEDISGRIKSGLEALPTPYMFDVTDYPRITHSGLKEHIDHVGKSLFIR